MGLLVECMWILRRKPCEISPCQQGLKVSLWILETCQKVASGRGGHCVALNPMARLLTFDQYLEISRLKIEGVQCLGECWAPLLWGSVGVADY